MNYRLGIIAALAIAILGFLVWGLIFLTVDPGTSDVLTKSALFVSIFATLAGLAIPLLFWGKLSAGNREVVYANFPIAVRQGILIALVGTGLIILQSIRSLSWWDAILVVAGAGFVELAFRSRT